MVGGGRREIKEVGRWGFIYKLSCKHQQDLR